MNRLPPQLFYVLGALAVLGFVYWKGGKALAAAGNAVNPVNHDNVFSSSANALGSAISGDDSFSLGGTIYDWTHPSNPFTK